MSSVQPLLDAAGRRRSPATTPGFRTGIAPRNKGQRYPADPGITQVGLSEIGLGGMIGLGGVHGSWGLALIAGLGGACINSRTRWNACAWLCGLGMSGHDHGAVHERVDQALEVVDAWFGERDLRVRW